MNEQYEKSLTKLELDKVLATGDASGIWLALFAVSLSGWAVMMVLKRKPGQKGDPK